MNNGRRPLSNYEFLLIFAILAFFILGIGAIGFLITRFIF